MDLYDLPMAVPLGPWREHALCSAMVQAGEAKTEWWHPIKGGDSNRTTAKAIAICNECPVKAECRDHAEKAGERHGIWGGVGPKHRRVPLGSKKACRRCGDPFPYRGGNALYCSTACRDDQHRERARDAIIRYRQRKREVA